MKKLCLLLATLTMLFACTKSDPFFDGILDGSNLDAISPVQQIGSLETNQSAVWTALNANGVQYGEPTAIIFNDYSECLAEFPEIDFARYSLVVGQVYFGSGGSKITGQRVVIGKDCINVYVSVDEVYEVNTCDVRFFPFAALYAKLPDLPVKFRSFYNGVESSVWVLE